MADNKVKPKAGATSSAQSAFSSLFNLSHSLSQMMSSPSSSDKKSRPPPLPIAATSPLSTASSSAKNTPPGTPNTTAMFTSNMCAVLNDPRKDRAKVAHLFTKTWGSDFTENAHIPPIMAVHPTYVNIKPADFKEFLAQYTERHSKHLKLLAQADKSAKDLEQQQTKIENDLEKIPKIFFDPNFSLDNKETFAAIFSLHKRQNDSPVMTNFSLREAHVCQNVLDQLSFYLDITEAHISKQIATKANTFFHAMTSQDEVQEQILKTCKSVKLIRQNIKDFDEKSVLTSIKILKMVSLKIRYKNLVEKFELMSSVYQTQPTIQLHLGSSEYTGALDLIAMSQDILRQELRGIRSLRHFDSQFAEIEKVIDKMLHDEFSKYIISDLSRAFTDGSEALNQEKLSSLMLGILRTKVSPFIDLCKDEICIYLKATVKQTINEYVAQIEDEDYDEPQLPQQVPNDEAAVNIRLVDRVRQLKIQEFLHLLSRILANIKTMLGRVQSIIKIIVGVLNSAAGYKEQQDDEAELIPYSTTNQKELISKQTHAKLSTGVKELMVISSDYAQERLVSLLEAKFKDNGIEKLTSNDFISLTNLIEQFIIDFDSLANKKTSSMRSWLQNQANKFLYKFHTDRKEKLLLALDSERWKQVEIPVEIQNLVDHVLANSLNASLANLRKADASRKALSNFLTINSERYVVFNTVLVTIKLMVDYCQFSMEFPTLTFDVMTRLIELFKTFNSKSYQMILGGGAVQQNVLKVITFKTLAITIRCLECVLIFLPHVKDFYKERISEKQAQSSLKQFDQLIKEYNEHKSEVFNKLIFMVDEIFRELISQYEVIAPVPSQCFRSICQQITRVHEIVTEILSTSTVDTLFREIHARFKQRLGQRLKELNVVNDGGPQHALIFSDMSYYIKQFKSLSGLHSIQLNFEDVWSV